MSATHKSLFKKGYKHPLSKSIIQYSLEGNFIKKWDSASQIEREMGLCRRKIGKYLQNKIEICFNYKWKYEKEEG